MLQNESVSGWLNVVKTNTANTMQIIAEKKLNPNNYHISSEIKKRLRWLYVLYYEEKGNVSKTARKIGLSRQWLSNLKQIFENNNRDPRALEPKSKAPSNTSNRERVPKEVEEIIIKIRDDSLNCWGKIKIATVLKRDYGITINHNTVNKYLHKYKRIDPKISLKNSLAFQEKKQRNSQDILLKVKFRPPSKIKDYAPGALVEKDMKYVAKPKQEHSGKHRDNYWYQFTEIDSFTRIRALEVSDAQDTNAAIMCHKEALKRFPFKVACENTDNGFENNNNFSKELKKEMIFHFYSNASTPTDNPRVERSHLTDDIEFYNKGNVSNNLIEQKEMLKGWEYIYNFKRPNQALGYLTPMEFYKLWKESPEKAYAIVEKWKEYLKKQRIRLAKARRIKKKEQIETLMEFIDAKLNQKKDDVKKASFKLIDCQLCSVA
jgi:transposase-like protein